MKRNLPGAGFRHRPEMPRGTNSSPSAAVELPDDIREPQDECGRLNWIRMPDGDRFLLPGGAGANFSDY
jgi:hypothetical protein